MRGSLLLFLIFLACVLVIARFALVAITVESDSMSPALEHGDRVLVWRYWPGRLIRRGQIVLVWPWLSNSINPRSVGRAHFVPYIKRVVGLPGDSIVTSRTDLAETARRLVRDTHDSQGKRVWHIPPSHLFVRGDNPLGGIDSLTWGPVPLKSILGMVIMRLPVRHDNSRTATDHHRSCPVPLQAGHPAPPFTAKTLRGEYVTLDTYRGRSIVLLFISQCDPCREVIPRYESLLPMASRSSVDLLLASTDSVERTRAFVDELGTSLPVLVAPGGANSIMTDYRTRGTPYYCLVDAQGKVGSAGYPSWEWGEWKALVEGWR